MTGQLLIQKRDGREVIDWDTEQNGGGPLDPCHAQAKFEEMIRGGAFAFAETITDKGLEREQIHGGGFDPETQTRVVMTPALAGGC